ncbi:hypothetical protein B5M44_21890 [Shinella sumterensis]|uniref:hypothetical protein n=1 Tax=Shinella sumterensis TaxID=1967501 RepID=UPI00106DFB3A|nr:hypothetical protein [Shinella sumterensis]MCD1266930.1 hypothetical protein [Shinella sumterensis]TFE95190.1 hypothetical protein B5M44_21890 [Shinella sumterensis]
MSKRNNGHSPNFIHASKVTLPDCEATADTIVQMLVEGYPDGFTARERCAKPVERREDAA